MTGVFGGGGGVGGARGASSGRAAASADRRGRVALGWLAVRTETHPLLACASVVWFTSCSLRRCTPGGLSVPALASRRCAHRLPASARGAGWVSPSPPAPPRRHARPRLVPRRRRPHRPPPADADGAPGGGGWGRRNRGGCAGGWGRHAGGDVVRGGYDGEGGGGWGEVSQSGRVRGVGGLTGGWILVRGARRRAGGRPVGVGGRSGGRCAWAGGRPARRPGVARGECAGLACPPALSQAAGGRAGLVAAAAVAPAPPPCSRRRRDGDRHAAVVFTLMSSTRRRRVLPAAALTAAPLSAPAGCAGHRRGRRSGWKRERGRRRPVPATSRLAATCLSGGRAGADRGATVRTEWLHRPRLRAARRGGTGAGWRRGVCFPSVARPPTQASAVP